MAAITKRRMEGLLFLCALACSFQLGELRNVDVRLGAAARLTCQDDDPGCPQLSHFCHLTHTHTICRKTCGQCGTMTHPVPETTSPKPVISSPTPSSGSSQPCQDDDPGCPQLSHFCHLTHTHTICRKTCGTCHLPARTTERHTSIRPNTTPSPTSTTPLTVPTTTSTTPPTVPTTTSMKPAAVSTTISTRPDITTSTTKTDTAPPLTTLKPVPPLTCRVCEAPLCDHEVEWIKRCAPETPYCATRYVNHPNGSHQLTRRCAFKHECDRWMLGGTVNSTKCQSYQPGSIYLDQFDCFFCCTADHCNRHSKPDRDTWYTGH